MLTVHVECVKMSFPLFCLRKLILSKITAIKNSPSFYSSCFLNLTKQIFIKWKLSDSSKSALFSMHFQTFLLGWLNE